MHTKPKGFKKKLIFKYSWIYPTTLPVMETKKANEKCVFLQNNYILMVYAHNFLLLNWVQNGGKTLFLIFYVM